MSPRPRPAPIDAPLPQRAEEPSIVPDRTGELDSLDLAVHVAVAAMTTPTLDRVFRRLSRAADHSRLWLASAAVLGTVGGARGRRAAVNGLASHRGHLAGCQPAAQPLGRRDRPHRAAHHVPITRHVTMPRTASFPSGHAASASAFATGVATAWPEAGLRTRRGNARRGLGCPHGRPLSRRRDSRIPHRYHAGAAHRRRVRAPPRPTGQRFERHLP